MPDCAPVFLRKSGMVQTLWRCRPRDSLGAYATSSAQSSPFPAPAKQDGQPTSLTSHFSTLFLAQ